MLNTEYRILINMPKRTVILIIVLTLLTGVLVFLAIRNEQQVGTDQDMGTDSVEEQEVQLDKTATMFFDPSVAEVSAATLSASTVDVYFDSKEHTIDSIQLELVYDPDVLTNVSIAAPPVNFFGETGDYLVPMQIVDNENGRIRYAIAMTPESEAVWGVGAVAQISFSLNPQSTATQTQIEVMDRSMAVETTSHESVLAPVDPLVITITR